MIKIIIEKDGIQTPLSVKWDPKIAKMMEENHNIDFTDEISIFLAKEILEAVREIVRKKKDSSEEER